jgi:hypothetical protein
MATKKPEPTAASCNDLLNMLTVAAEGQLRALRALRRRQLRPEPKPGKRRSNISIVEDVLRSSSGPLHISQILTQAQERYQVHLSRESLVSALTKKVLDRHTFCRVGRNTFDLLERTPS